MLMSAVYSATVDYVSLSVSNADEAQLLYAVGIVAGSHVSVTSLSHDDDGSHLSTHLLPAPWIKPHHLYDFSLILSSLLVLC